MAVARVSQPRAVEDDKDDLAGDGQEGSGLGADSEEVMSKVGLKCGTYPNGVYNKSPNAGQSWHGLIAQLIRDPMDC